ncbi:TRANSCRIPTION REPRESSOR OFP17-LIKE [Salix koriyanagi]|uniref:TRANSCRIPTION REPRESSOR OFP17-LIKE n=2 Tax=Salix TaxID=40685 RepID=A0A9Q0W704_9ROSI|nr:TRANSCRIPTION REPRESSOR OFP17-LIKE [Salix koriyanagi]
MKMKALVVFRSKLFSPCRKLLLFFRFKIKRPVFIRSLRLRLRSKKPRKAPQKNRVFKSLLSVFHPLRKSRKMDRVSELMSVSELECERMLFPSPLTPAYIKASLAKKRQTFSDEDVEDACRSFENYLMEMMIEEGKVRDLMDVEELLYCWKNLKCPVFIDLVGRFYGELCKDLFSPDDDNTEIYSPK